MNITDEHVRAVRACLLDPDEFHRRTDDLERNNDLDGYKAMLAGTLFQLVWHTFEQSDDRQRDVVQWVSRIRARDADQDIDQLEPVPAEQLLFQFLGMPSSYAEVDEETRAVTQYVVLLSLYEELDLADDELDELLGDAREAVAQVT